MHLEKTEEPLFPDEWDYVIQNYTSGASDPEIINSIAAIALQQTIKEHPVSIPPAPEKEKTTIAKKETAAPMIVQPAREQPKPIIAIPVTIEEKFVSRKKILVTEIPLSGDSIELRFYDNAEIDGDSISLFLNDQLIFRHIRLTGNAYNIKLAVHDLKEINELTMVAENLGSIPPNTSFMVALVGDKRYEARLESTEGSSAMIRLLKETESRKSQ